MFRDKNTVEENAELIHRTVLAVAADEYIPGLENVLAQAKANGWDGLVAAIGKILEGERDLAQLAGLDGEDRMVVSAILQGIENPASLPDLAGIIDPAIAGPSMASMIYDAAAGNANAIEAIRSVSHQMSGAKGDFSKIPNAINLMVAGEKQEDVLCKDMGGAGRSLIRSILEGLKNIGI